MEGVEGNFYYVLTVVAFLLLTGQNLETRNYMEGNFTIFANESHGWTCLLLGDYNTSLMVH